MFNIFISNICSMESEEFNRYKILCAKNKKMLESVS